MPDPAEVIRRNIRARLKVLGWNDADLARNARITKTYVSQLLRDEPEGRNDNPGIKQLAKIAGALGTSVSELLTDASETSPKSHLRAVGEMIRAMEQTLDDSEVRAFLERLKQK